METQGAEEMKEFKLTELIDVKALQRIQDGFSAFTGMAALTTDEKGVPVTQGSGFTDFCFRLTRQSELGCKRCEECDRQGALKTLEKGEPVIYHCHAGLVDYAAPIMVDGTFIGSFIGGQIRTSAVNEQQFRETARELSIDEELYVSAAKRVHWLETEEVERAARFLADIAEILSEMAYKSAKSLMDSRKMERSARSQTSFMLEMNKRIQEDVQTWLTDAQQALASDNKLVMKQTLSDVLVKGPSLLAAMSETAEYAQMTKGRMELNEVTYEIADLIDFACKNVEPYKRENVVIRTDISRDVSRRLFGDEGRLVQILGKLLMNAISYTQEGEIVIKVDSEKSNYAENLTIQISDTGVGIQKQELDDMNEDLAEGNISLAQNNADQGTGLSMVAFLVKQMSGSISAESEEGKGTVFTIHLPQLRLM